MKLLIAFAVCGLVYIIQTLIYKRYWNRDLSIDVSFSTDFVREGEGATLIEVIENNKLMCLPILQIKFAITRTFRFVNQDNSSVTDLFYRNDFFSMRPYCKITREYPFTATARGCYRLFDVDMIGYDFLVANKHMLNLHPEAMLCVLPRRVLIDDMDMTAQKLMGEIVRNIKTNEDPFTFGGIRTYQPYDSLSAINWKATARLSELMVNQYSSTFSGKVVILLNTEHHALNNAIENEEYAIRLAASFASYFIDNKIPVAFATNGADAVDRQAIRIESGADAAHLLNIEILLSRIDLSGSACRFSDIIDENVTNEDNAEYLIISNYRKKDLADKIEEQRGMGRHISWIIPEECRTKAQRNAEIS